MEWGTDLSEFSWHAPPKFEVDGRVLRRGGERGEAVAAIAGMGGDSRGVAVLGLHDPWVRARVWCASENQAIEVVEKWLATLLSS